MSGSSREVESIADRLASLEVTAKKSKSAARELLALLRDPAQPLRKPSIVVEHAPGLLRETPSDFDMKEQLCLAALDCGEYKVAQQHIEELQDCFSEDSTRVQLLTAKLMEAKGDFVKAKSLYDAMLQKNKANSMALKRLVAIHRSKGEYTEAVKALTDLLKMTQSDPSSWKEMLSLQIQLGNIDAACFCAEEVILSDPHSYLHHTKYAELRHSEGGEKNILCARRHYAQAVELNPKGNTRAMWGLCMATKNLSEIRGKNTGRSDAETNTGLSRLAREKLLRVYSQNADPAIAAAVKNVLDGAKIQ